MKNFWNKLPKPFLALAPMEEVTDTAFRQVIASIGKPDVFFTEFVSVDGFCSLGKEKLLSRLLFTKQEKPIVAQIWGTDSVKFEKTAKEITKMGFDGIDINMGCPDKDVVKKGAGGGLIGNFELAEKIIKATKKGAANIPVSVKTRIGIREIVTEEWIGFLLKQNLAAITIHGRTVKEMSKVDAHWEEIKKAVQIKKKLNSKTLIIGNGDIKGYQEAINNFKESGVDGIMIGRGVLQNPWAFNPDININNVSTKQRLELLLEHLKIFENIWGKNKNYAIMKKFYKAYVSDYEGAKGLRNKLMETKNIQEAEKILSKALAL